MLRLSAKLVLTFVLGSGVIVSGCSTHMSEEDVKIAVSELRTLANAAGMLLDAEMAGDTTRTFVHAQSDLLLSKVEDTIATLDANAGEADNDRSHAREIALRLADRLRRVKSGIDTAEAAKKDIHDLADEAEKIEEKLKR